MNGRVGTIEPFRKFPPLRGIAPINRHSPLDQSVLGDGQILHDLLRYFGQVTPSQVVVCLQEYLSEVALAHGVVLLVESVEAMKSVARMHVQGVDR